MAKILSDHRVLLEVLREAGLADSNTRRVVIDIQTGKGVIVHTEQWGDEKLLSVIEALRGVEITREAASDGEANGLRVDDAVG